MKLMTMHKVDAAMEAGKLPSKELIEGMGALVGEIIQKGIFLDGDGLKPSSSRARVSVTGSASRVEKGPYAGKNELITGAVRLRAQSLDEAVEHATKIAQALGDGAEIEVGPLTEAWDLGVAPVPTP